MIRQVEVKDVLEKNSSGSPFGISITKRLFVYYTKEIGLDHTFQCESQLKGRKNEIHEKYEDYEQT